MLRSGSSRELRLAPRRSGEKDFLSAIDAAVANIVSAPQRWPVKGRWRLYYLRQFPYVIAYREAGELIQIGAVAHQHRRPNYWSRRR